MAGSQPAPERTRASVWRRPYAARERIILSIQAKFDRRNIPPLWLWPIIPPEEIPGTSVNPEDYWESSRSDRRYRNPLPAHIYLDWQPRNKGAKKGITETTLTAEIAISRAEVRRLGRELGDSDEATGLVSDPSDEGFFYLPRPGDLFTFGGDYFEIIQWKPADLYGPTSIPVTWKGTANQFRDDSSAPYEFLPEPPSPEPPLESVPRHAWRG